MPVTVPALSKILAGTFALGILTLFGSADFKGTVTLGSVLVGLLVVMFGGFFAIRNQQAKAANDAAAIWRQEAEAHEARSDRLAEELAEAVAERQTFEREQQDLRHGLKDEIAGLKAALKVEEAKHDLNALLERMQNFHADAMTAMVANTDDTVTTLTDLITAISAKLDQNQTELMVGQGEQTDLLKEIRDSLKRD